MTSVNGKRYCLSNYVIFQEINKEGDHILIHSYLNNIDIVDKDISNKLLKIKSGYSVDDMNENTLNELIGKGYLINDELEDRKIFNMVVDKLSEQKNKHHSYVLIPTYNCNFSCPYCFEGKLTRNGLNVLMDDKIG